jgi:hypothetical protein
MVTTARNAVNVNCKSTDFCLDLSKILAVASEPLWVGKAASFSAPVAKSDRSSPVGCPASPSREVGLRDSELEKLEGRKDLFILYFL